MGPEIGLIELVRESLVAVVREMRANIIHASYSSIIYEGHDFSCALVSIDGRLIAQSLDDNPLHIFAVPYSAREIIQRFVGDIHEGDIFLHNDPYTGGTHLNDMLLLRPVFVGGQLLLFSATRCHWGDVGGMTPGSLSGQAKEILQEGIRVVPTRICERGMLNRAFLELLFQNMRNAAEREGDFNVMMGAARKAGERVARLARRFGSAPLIDAIEELMIRSEAVMRERIRNCSEGVYHAEGYIESDGHQTQPLVAKLRLTVSGSRIIADFGGTSPQTEGPTNVGPSMAFNAVCTVVKAFFDPRTSINHGSFQPITVIAPERSFINARWPAPCGGMAEVKALLDSLMVVALGQAMPSKISGGLKGGANHVLVGGDDREGKTFLFYEYPAGGTGGSAKNDGCDAVRAFPEGDFNSVQSIEMIESSMPLRVESYGIREGSCGDGASRGGFGMTRRVRILCNNASLSILSERNVIPPYGVMRGTHGAPNRFVVLRDGKEIRASGCPGKVTGFPLMRRDLVAVDTAGGGGCGDPLDRDPERVRRDVSGGYLSVAQAACRYGVVFRESGVVDLEGTVERRRIVRDARIYLPLKVGGAAMARDTRRRMQLPLLLKKRLKSGEGGLVELVPNIGAALRAWVSFVDLIEESVVVDQSTLALLAMRCGDFIEVRDIRSLY